MSGCVSGHNGLMALMTGHPHTQTPDHLDNCPAEQVTSISRLFRESQPVRALVRRLEEEQCVVVEGMIAPASALLAAALCEGRTVLLLVTSQDAGERAADATAAFLESGEPWFLVGHSSHFLEDGQGVADSPAAADRLAAMDCLSRGGQCLLIATTAGLLQYTCSPHDMREAILEMAPGCEIDLPATLHKLVGFGYERVDMVQNLGEFAVRGGILDLFPPQIREPVRVDLFGDQVETLRTFNTSTQRTTGSLPSLRILPVREPPVNAKSTFIDFLPPDTLILVEEAAALLRRWEEFEDEVRGELAAAELDAAHPLESSASIPFLPLDDAGHRLTSFPTLFLNQISHGVPWGKARGTVSLLCDPAPNALGDMAALGQRLLGWRERDVHSWVFSPQWHRLAEILRNEGIEVATRGDETREGARPASVLRTPMPVLSSGLLPEGFVIPSARLAVLSDNEVFGGVKMRRARRVSRESTPLTSFLELRPGDMVVHVDHGIGYFRGLKSMEVEGVRRDYLHLEYAQGDKLFVPSDQVSRVQRYVGSEDHPPAVHRLGGTDWARTKRRVREAVEEMAKELLELYATRSSREGHAFGPDTAWQTEMENSFVYEETPDQLRSISEIKADLESEKPMDRLICGDVGYGKTEVAIRAAFKVVMDGKQVAILVPTTVLAQQHLNTFNARLSGFPVKIEMLSRFRSKKEQSQTVEGLKQGSVDIVIGTHRLLSKDVAFKDLGLVVIDEEQRFGVAHKEKLKQLRQMVDVLTLTATPIPRTLHMSLATIRDMSVMNQAPEGRTAVRTFLREYSDDLVRRAILRELERDGQVYFLHNRVENMAHVLDDLRRLVPKARIGMAHGQMPEHELEAVMLDFYERHYDVLCCTTIIESGLDIPNVNTIIINDSDRLGLAQLYQLRGRVGRSNRQAYCFLLFKPEREISDLAHKRLHALREFTDLGSGFKIALRDLEIRGAGNLLGPEQHGALMSVGFDLYCQMISEAVRTLRDEPPPPPLPPVDLPMAAFIPAEYIPAESLRVEFYKRLSSPTSAEDVTTCADEMKDRFGPIPASVRNLLSILRLRIDSRQIGVTSISPEKKQVVIRLGPRLRLTPTAIAILQRKHKNTRLLTDRAIVPIDPQRGALGPVTEVMASLRMLQERRAAAKERLES